jgi:hypothetical protein
MSTIDRRLAKLEASLEQKARPNGRAHADPRP